MRFNSTRPSRKAYQIGNTNLASLLPTTAQKRKTELTGESIQAATGSQVLSPSRSGGETVSNRGLAAQRVRCGRFNQLVGTSWVASSRFVRAVLKLAPNPWGRGVCVKPIGFLQRWPEFHPPIFEHLWVASWVTCDRVVSGVHLAAFSKVLLQSNKKSSGFARRRWSLGVRNTNVFAGGWFSAVENHRVFA
jgi:hypothetical protein